MPRTLTDRKKDEFMELELRSVFVSINEAKFQDYLNMLQFVTTKEERIRLFGKGLDPEST